MNRMIRMSMKEDIKGGMSQRSVSEWKNSVILVTDKGKTAFGTEEIRERKKTREIKERRGCSTKLSSY